MLANPQQVGWYITVETITQNVIPVESPLTQSTAGKERIADCKCGLKLELVEVSEKVCSWCKFNKTKYFSSGCLQEACEKCQYCHSQELVEKMVQDKTRVHNTYLE